VSAYDFVLLAAVVVLSALFVGCGAGAIRTNATIAGAMLEVQSESGPLIRGLRIDASVNAARAAQERGEPEDIAQQEAQTVAGRWSCAIDGHRIFAGAVGSYIDALVLWQAGRDFELTDAVPFVTRALDAYRALVGCLSSLGSDILPAVPSFFDVIPPAWSTE